MAHIIILGAGIGGMSAAYQLRAALGRGHSITVIGDGPHFSFTPSNPWVAVGWRDPGDIQIDVHAPLARHGIAFVDEAAASIQPESNRIVTASGKAFDYDYLVIATGPRLAFDEVPGLGPDRHTQSVCTTTHAGKAWAAYQRFLDHPGPIIVGAAPGVSCFGPAYEFAMILDADLRKRRLRDLADMGDTGIAFVALPQIPLRNVTWTRSGKWVHLAKIAFEKYFLAKVRSGNTEPIYEKYVLQALGIERLKTGTD